MNDTDSFTFAEATPAAPRSHEGQPASPVDFGFEAVRSATVVGIDIGSGCAKAVVLEGKSRSKSIVVREFALLPIKDPAQPFATTLRLLLGKLRTRSRECALAAWPPSAQVRFLDANGTYTGRRRREIPAPEVARPESAEEPSLNTEGEQVLDASPIPGSKSADSPAKLLECGILRADLDVVHQAFQDVRRSLRLIQLTPVALFNAFALSQPEIAARESYFIVDIGKTHTTLVAGAQGAMRLMRVVEIGWDYIAEALDLEFGTDCRDDLQRLPVDDDGMRSATLDATHRLALEIERSMDHLHRDEHYARPLRFYISGPLNPESLPIQALATHLEIPAMTWNPLRTAAAGKRALAEYHLLEELSRLPAAAGAALQCLV